MTGHLSTNWLRDALRPLEQVLTDTLGQQRPDHSSAWAAPKIMTRIAAPSATPVHTAPEDSQPDRHHEQKTWHVLTSLQQTIRQWVSLLPAQKSSAFHRLDSNHRFTLPGTFSSAAATASTPNNQSKGINLARWLKLPPTAAQTASASTTGVAYPRAGLLPPTARIPDRAGLRLPQPPSAPQLLRYAVGSGLDAMQGYASPGRLAPRPAAPPMPRQTHPASATMSSNRHEKLLEKILQALQRRRHVIGDVTGLYQ